MFADLPPGRERELILAEIEHFRALGMPFEWKVYDLDRPADLRRRLEGEGFEAGEEEAFLVMPVAPRPASPPPPGIRITQDRGPRPAPRRGGRPGGSLGSGSLVAPRHPRGDALDPAGRDHRLLRLRGMASLSRPAGRLPAGSRFADLHGGAVLPAHRGKGIFGVLLDLRLSRRRGPRVRACRGGRRTDEPAAPPRARLQGDLQHGADAPGRVGIVTGRGPPACPADPRVSIVPGWISPLPADLTR
jgi:hypothetical protein